MKNSQTNQSSSKLRPAAGLRFLALLLLLSLIPFTLIACQKKDDTTAASQTAAAVSSSDQQASQAEQTGQTDQAGQTASQTAEHAGAQPATVEKGRLIVGMELAYPPFEGKDAAGNPEGVSPDFVKALADHLKLDLVIENIAWDGLIPALETGKVDLVMSSMTITEKREEVIDFSEPYANAYLALLTATPAKIGSIEDLNRAGRKVAVKTGSTGFFYAQKNLSEAEIVSFPDESACVTEVSQGKADAFIYDQLTIYRNWKLHEDTCTPVFIPFQDAEKWGVALKQGNDDLRLAVNDFIAVYQADGGFDRLTEQHLADEKKVFDELGFKWFFNLEP